MAWTVIGTNTGSGHILAEHECPFRIHCHRRPLGDIGGQGLRRLFRDPAGFECGVNSRLGRFARHLRRGLRKRGGHANRIEDTGHDDQREHGEQRGLDLHGNSL